MVTELLRRRVIPVIEIDDAVNAEPLAEALLNGGIDVIEITFRTPAAQQAIKRISKSFPDMLLGAGTVLSREDADRAVDAGASFGLAPGVNAEVVKRFQASGGLFIPGVMTPSEVELGLGLGCNLLKFFPAELAGGTAMLKALTGPYESRGVRFCPAGGISGENMLAYLALPIVAMVGGSWLATKEQVAAGDWTAITRQVREAIVRIHETKGVAESA